MAEIVVMPKLGLLMETGVVSAWRVSEGDQVKVGDVIAEITTEKITYELEAQGAGVLLRIILAEDGEVPVGDPIAIIGEPGEDISAFGGVSAAGAAAGGVAPTHDASAAATAAGEPAPVAGEPGAQAVPVHAPGERIVASPAAKKAAAELGVDLAFVAGSGPAGRITLEDVTAAAALGGAGLAPAFASAGTGAGGDVGAEVFATPTAKRLASELGVDLGGVHGSGPSGRIRVGDVQAAAESPSSATPIGTAAAASGLSSAPLSSAQSPGAGAAGLRGGVAEEIPYAGMRRLIGEHMDASRRLAPTVTYDGLADVQASKALVAQVNATRPPDDRINITAVVIKAVALTLERMPRFNASLEGDVIKVWRSVNVGVAVALTDGLIVPVIRDANLKSVGQIAREVKDLAGRAREGRLMPDEVAGGTFTVSTLGPYRSVDYFSPIINQPEAAILGVGRMRDEVVAIDGEPAVHVTMGLSLTCDHRMLDGAPAAEFLRMLMDYLAEPLSMLV